MAAEAVSAMPRSRKAEMTKVTNMATVITLLAPATMAQFDPPSTPRLPEIIAEDVAAIFSRDMPTAAANDNVAQPPPNSPSPIVAVISSQGFCSSGSGCDDSTMPDPGTGTSPYKPILDHISRSEGTAHEPGGGYNTSLGYGRFLPNGQEQNLTGKTLNEILVLGDYMRRQPGNPNSSALGRYQIVGMTLRGLMRELGLSGNEKFDEAMQDRLGAELVRRRGSNARGLAQEWASLRGDRLTKAVDLAKRISQGISSTPRL